MTSIVDSSDLIDVGIICDGPVDNWSRFSICKVLFWLTDGSITADDWLVDSCDGSDDKVLDFGINAEAKADFSFDLSNIPEPILGRWNCAVVWGIVSGASKSSVFMVEDL